MHEGIDNSPCLACRCDAAHSNHHFPAGADPGFWERGGLKNIFTTGVGGVPPPVTARGSGGAQIAPSRFFAFVFI